MQIKPRDIDVPADNPFGKDLLGRREAVEALTHLVGNIEEPCALAIDATWGAGKTTFLRIWARYLRNLNFPVIEFNAWETDFLDDPFVALSAEITQSLKTIGGEKTGDRGEAVRAAATEVLRKITPHAIRLAAGNVPGVGAALGEILVSCAEERLSQHREAGTAVGMFTKALQDAAATLSEVHGGRPLILMIDELDRCRPSYAVELLEVAKHLFSVDCIVFVLAVNRAQLAHSVRALYGSGFDADGYLHRFFDVDVQLPEPGRKAFIDAQLQATGLAAYFDQTPENPSEYHPTYFPKEVAMKEAGEDLRRMLPAFFGASDLGFRTISQAINRLGLVYGSLSADRHDPALATAVALILRTIDPGLYQRFNCGEATDLDVVSAVFDHPGRKALRHTEVGVKFEAAIILATLEDGLTELSLAEIEKEERKLSSPDPMRTPLLDWYRVSDIEHGETVFGTVRKTMQSVGNSQIGFREAVRRLELLSDGPDEPEDLSGRAGQDGPASGTIEG